MSTPIVVVSLPLGTAVSGQGKERGRKRRKSDLFRRLFSRLSSSFALSDSWEKIGSVFPALFWWSRVVSEKESYGPSNKSVWSFALTCSAIIRTLILTIKQRVGKLE